MYILTFEKTETDRIKIFFEDENTSGKVFDRPVEFLNDVINMEQNQKIRLVKSEYPDSITFCHVQLPSENKN